VSTTSPEVTVRKSSERSRYEAVIDGDVAGYADISEDADTVVFPHVEVVRAWQGQGVASALVRQAFDDVIASGKTITPLCPFAVGYVKRHPEYAEHTD
jgi:predicted GNAT family acetyltransferase